MSEYQHYEFLAVDRILTASQIDEIRAVSSRAEISATRFVNEYHWGDFHGDAHEFLSNYFDLLVYCANWGTHRVMIALPREAVDEDVLRRYEPLVQCRRRKDRVILDFVSESEDGGDVDDPSGWMVAAAHVREELLCGDMRPLYLAWLSALSEGREILEDDALDISMPVPAGLAKLSAAQHEFADILRVDPELIDAAAPHSAKPPAAGADVKERIEAMSDREKTELLFAIIDGKDPHAVTTLRRRLVRVAAGATANEESAPTARQLLAVADKANQLAEEEEQRRREAEQRRRTAEKAALRAAYLANLARREPGAWEDVERFVAAKQSKSYDEAVKLLADLRELAVQRAALDRFAARVASLRQKHLAKTTFIKRLQDAKI